MHHTSLWTEFLGMISNTHLGEMSECFVEGIALSREQLLTTYVQSHRRRRRRILENQGEQTCILDR